jgi:carboxyl-terminal processing protease
MLRLLFNLTALLLATGVQAQSDARWRSDALAFEQIVNDRYAYLDRLEGQQYRLTSKLRAEAENVQSQSDLLAFAERAILLLADHHVITGSSFDDSWAVVPSYSDLWIERKDGDYRIASVRTASPAAENGISRGDRLSAIDGKDIDDAVRAFWRDLGVAGKIDNDRAGFAARILAAGRRDRTRKLTVRSAVSGERRELILPSLYASNKTLPAIETIAEGAALRITINDQLYHTATIPAFDEAMAGASTGQPIIIDLTNTPSGGNTVVARAIMGWFVKQARSFQVHRSPAEERETGIPRQWVEQVLPRGKGKFHKGKITVRVSRWTGSMGEGLAVGFAALGAKVEGDRMAGLLGAIEDIKLPDSGLAIKLPTERLYTVSGTPRENFEPKRAKTK